MPQPPSDQPARRQCQQHRNKECIFLSTDPSRTDLVFKCEFCVAEQSLQGKFLIPISQIQESDTKTVFWHWPLPENSELLDKVRALSVRPKPNATFKEDIDKYFKQLRIDVLAKIDEVQASMKEKADQLWDFDIRILQEYSQLCAKDALKNELLDSSREIEEISRKVRETIAEVISNQAVASETLESSLGHLAVQEAAVDFEEPLKLKTEILERLAKISMF